MILVTPPTAIPQPAQPIGDPDALIATATPTPQPTVALNPAEIPPTVSLDELLLQAPPAPQINTRPQLFSFAITIAGGSGTFQPVPIDTARAGQTVLFERNPINPDEYALVNTAGQIYVGSLAGAGGLSGDPFTPFTYEVQNRDDNDAAIGAMSWSPSGVLAFVIDARKTNKDGIWIMDGGTPRQILRDCPYDGHAGCLTVSGNRNASQWRSDRLTWNTDGSRLLVELDIPNEGRRGVIVLNTGNPADILPTVYRYDSASWSMDEERVLVSGVGGDGQPVMAWLNPNDGGVQVIYNGADQRIAPRAAVERPNGQILAFGSDLFTGGAAFLMDSNGTIRSERIGTTSPTRIDWSADRNAAIVQTEDGRTYVVNADSGAIQDISATVGGQAVNFVNGAVPAAVPDVPAAPIADSIPSGVIAGSRYAPGQQLRVAAPNGINMREQPNTDAAVIGGVLTGDYVAILAGPLEADGISWWRIKAADNTQGWIAGTINGFDTLFVP